MVFTLTSSAFTHDHAIPPLYTCDGEDRSPPLAWSDIPPGTQSFVLMIDDPDAPDPQAPKLTWVHWLLYNLPATIDHLDAGCPTLPSGTKLGLNNWHRTQYGGPCPPIGRHRYFHQLYALDCLLPDLHHPTQAQLTQAMKGHILGKAELVGTYQRA
jgi:Raf kinase inhibitor-like YbhB/YbcL family protein